MNAPWVAQPRAVAATAGPAAATLRLLLAAQPRMGGHAQRLAPGWLTQSEQSRLSGMRKSSRRQEFVACRYALRQLLASAHGIPAEHWRLDAPDGSPPTLNVSHHGADAAASTHLSLSHSDTYLACAAGPQPVGIDLEVKDLRVVKRDVLALAAMACSDGEMRQLRGIDCERTRYRLFLQWWSLKEAYFKCLGTGLDFASIRSIECRPADLDEGRALAHARSWKGRTSADHAVLLSVCALEGPVQPCALHVDADIEWKEEGGWNLIAMPS